MSNYHVESIDKPAALSSEAIKALRKEQVQGLSRRQLMRSAIGVGMLLWITELLTGTLGFLWPNLAGGFGAPITVGSLEDIKASNSTLPIEEGFPAYYPDARAFVMLVDPGQQSFVAGTDTTGDGTALNVRALYQRCPHLGCKPNPCLKNFWIECPCHGSRYDRLGIKAAGTQYGPAPRSMDRFSITVDAEGILTINTGKITLGPLPVALGQPGHHPAAHANGLHLADERRTRTRRSGCRPPVPRTRPRRWSASPRRPPCSRWSSSRNGPPRSSGSPRTPAGWASWPSSSSCCSWRCIGSTSSADRSGSRSRASRPKRTRSRSPRWSAATTSSRPTAPAATATRARAVSGPVLNSQEKLYQHLNADYLNTILQVGGRYACGNFPSVMPVWSNTATPPGPLNYVQIQDLIAFIRAPNTQTYTIRDAELNEPKIDPITGKTRTFVGWVDPTYKPAPGATPYPACWADSFATPAPSGGTGSPAPSASARDRLAGTVRAGGTVTLDLTIPLAQPRTWPTTRRR